MNLSDFVIPIMFLFIIVYGLKKNIDIYDTFIDGAVESFNMIIKLFPCLLAMMVGINIFLQSNIFSLFKFITIIPYEIIPMALMRPISGTSSLAILSNIYSLYGPDSFLGMLGSFIQGSTDTTFYVITLYFGSIGIKKIRYALWAGLCADLIGITASIILANLLF